MGLPVADGKSANQPPRFADCAALIRPVSSEALAAVASRIFTLPQLK
jgi:hypothetical protein